MADSIDPLLRELERLYRDLRTVEERLSLRADKFSILLDSMDIQVRALRIWQAEVQGGLSGITSINKIVWAVLGALIPLVLWAVAYWRSG